MVQHIPQEPWFYAGPTFSEAGSATKAVGDAAGHPKHKTAKVAPDGGYTTAESKVGPPAPGSSTFDDVHAMEQGTLPGPELPHGPGSTRAHAGTTAAHERVAGTDGAVARASGVHVRKQHANVQLPPLESRPVVSHATVAPAAGSAGARQDSSQASGARSAHLPNVVVPE